MFEFLEKCDRQLFNNTLELESQMRTNYAFVSMRKICEYILKEMYDDFQNNSYNRWLPKLDKYNELIDMMGCNELNAILCRKMHYGKPF